MADTTIEIRRPDVVRDIEELAQRTGRGVVDAVAEAVREKLGKGAPKRHRTPEQDAELARILARIDALPKVGKPITDAELYDEDGLPR